jgi:hypothetical protein
LSNYEVQIHMMEPSCSFSFSFPLIDTLCQYNKILIDWDQPFLSTNNATLGCLWFDNEIECVAH